MRTLIAAMASLALANALAGCSTVGMSIPGQIAPPSSRIMVPPEQLKPVHAGEDLVQALAELRAVYARESLKERQLQAYVKRITTPAKD